MTSLAIQTKPRRTPYQGQIEPLARGHDCRQIEAFMRCEHGTLDRLSPAKFRAEVNLAIQCIMADPDGAERLAQSYGF